jgi:RNA polymerase sigma-70 factor, ECF subfamily
MEERMRAEAEAELIARARHDREAFGEIYDLYVHRVYAFCLGHSASREEAEDLTAQTFERALTAIGRYEARGVPFSAWLLRIAANAAVDRARRGNRVILLTADRPPDEWDHQPAQALAEQWVERWERAAWLRGHLITLPEDQQRAVRLRFYEDRALLDVATHMGRSEGAVKQLLQRALRALRVRLEQEAMADA